LPSGDVGVAVGQPQAVSPIEAPVVWLAPRDVPLTLRTSGSEAIRAGSFLGVKLLLRSECWRAGRGMVRGSAVLLLE
jgi:hypothetical protein